MVERVDMDGSGSVYSSCIGGSEGDGWKSRYGWKWEYRIPGVSSING